MPVSAPAICTIYTPSNSLELEEEMEGMRVREKEKKKTESVEVDVIGRGQLKARKRVWLHYTGRSIVLQK